MGNNKVAVYLHDFNDIISFCDSNSFKVYTPESDGWSIERTVVFDKVSADSLSELRKQTAEIAKLISDCGVIAGGELSGIPYSVFDMAGFSIFNISELSDEVLDGIVSDIEQGNAEKRMKDEIIKSACPVETDIPGIYFLDLIMLQTECPEISSKKAMTDFLEKTPFLELKLVCKHIPPWIENSGKYDIKSERYSDSFNAVITKKQC